MLKPRDGTLWCLYMAGDVPTSPCIPILTHRDMGNVFKANGALKTVIVRVLIPELWVYEILPASSTAS